MHEVRRFGRRFSCRPATVRSEKSHGRDPPLKVHDVLGNFVRSDECVGRPKVAGGETSLTMSSSNGIRSGEAQIVGTLRARRRDDSGVNRPGPAQWETIDGSNTRYSRSYDGEFCCVDVGRSLCRGQASEGEHWYTHHRNAQSPVLACTCAHVHAPHVHTRAYIRERRMDGRKIRSRRCDSGSSLFCALLCQCM